MTLRTVTGEHRNLQQISIYVPPISDRWYNSPITDNLYKTNPSLGWPDLDRLLVEFWELRSISSKFACSRTKSGSGRAQDWAKLFVPELMKRGIFDLVDVDEPCEPDFE